MRTATNLDGAKESDVRVITSGMSIDYEGLQQRDTRVESVASHVDKKGESDVAKVWMAKNYYNVPSIGGNELMQQVTPQNMRRGKSAIHYTLNR